MGERKYARVSKYNTPVKMMLNNLGEKTLSIQYGKN